MACEQHPRACYSIVYNILIMLEVPGFFVLCHSPLHRARLPATTEDAIMSGGNRRRLRGPPVLRDPVEEETSVPEASTLASLFGALSGWIRWHSKKSASYNSSADERALCTRKLGALKWF